VAQKVTTILIDDLTGAAIPAGKGDTIRFGLDGATFEIDLSDKNVNDMRALFAMYISAARKVSGSRGAGRGRSSTSSRLSNRDYDPRIVREWAESQGIEVNQRGRISADLVARFQESNA
jgi:hypothetical protein